jgi:hypothetical protein
MNPITRLVIYRNRWKLHQWLTENDPEETGLWPCQYDKPLCACHQLAWRETRGPPRPLGPRRREPAT